MAAAQHQRAGALPQQRGHALAQRVLRRFQRVALAATSPASSSRVSRCRQAGQELRMPAGPPRPRGPGYGHAGVAGEAQQRPSPALAWPS